MSDVKHYINARKWLDDPATVIDPLDRANLEAQLAISTAMREAGSEIRYLQNRIASLIEELLEPLVDSLTKDVEPTWSMTATAAHVAADIARRGEREMGAR